MANVDAPRGAKPVRHLNGGDPFVMNRYAVDASNSTAIFVGDFIILEADGNVAPYTGAGGGNLLGVCAGVDDDFDDLSRRHLPASTAGNIFVHDDPDVTFEVQSDGTTLVATAQGANVDVLPTAGSATTSISAHELKSSTLTASAAQIRLLRPMPREDNDVTAANSDWEVVINEHLFKSTSGI